jgi:hypothetical protein
MAVLDPEHTLDLGNTESGTICYHASYNMLSCILPVAIMQLSCYYATICYHADYNMLSCRLQFAFMQSADYNLLSCRVPYAIIRSTNILSLLSAAKANMLLSSHYHCFLEGFALWISGTYNSAKWVWTGMTRFFNDWDNHSLISAVEATIIFYLQPH